MISGPELVSVMAGRSFSRRPVLDEVASTLRSDSVENADFDSRSKLLVVPVLAVVELDAGPVDTVLSFELIEDVVCLSEEVLVVATMVFGENEVESVGSGAVVVIEFFEDVREVSSDGLESGFTVMVG